MSERKIFDSMGPKAKIFYSRLFNTVLLNAHAVKRGYFDTLLSETDDPSVMLRWKLAVPQIVHMVRIDNLKTEKD